MHCNCVQIALPTEQRMAMRREEVTNEPKDRTVSMEKIWIDLPSCFGPDEPRNLVG